MSHLPHGDTALRLGWRFLPPHIRSAVEQRLGSPVVEARSCDAGFTPGLASVLTCADGSRHFVKAASAKAQRQFVDHYRTEARILARLPPGTPAARLLWTLDADWFVFSTEYVTGASPRRPWRRGDVEACLDACETLAEVGTPITGIPLRPQAEAVASDPALWDLLPAGSVPSDQLAVARGLAERHAEVLVGDTLVHHDLRDDNVLIGAGGAAVFVDWNWPVRGPAWFDSLSVLIGPRGDGLDISRHLAERPLLRDVPDEAIDIALALLAGYFLGSASQPVPTNSPYLRDAQWWQGETCWNWLAERRGWELT